MNNSKIWLKRDKSCYMDLEAGDIINNGQIINMPKRFMCFLSYLCKNKGKPCGYYDIYVNAIAPNELEPSTSYNYYKTDPVIEIRKQLPRKLREMGYGITFASNKMDIEKSDITIINDTARKTYQIYLGADYNSVETNEMIRLQISDAYYEKYKVLELQGTSDKINQSLMDVFCFPNFEGGECLDLSENNRIFICAPNGFGKSILLKAILFATNPSSKLGERLELVEKLAELKKHYRINENYLTLFVDLKNVNERNLCKNEEDLCKWLLFASNLENLLKLDEFRELVTYYNQNERLLLIFDSVDEIIQKKEGDIGREEVLAKIRFLICADEIASNAKVIIASRPLAFSKDDMPYRYFYIESLISHRERAEAIIEKYSPKYKDDLVHYIYGDLYLKYLVVTPQLLIDVISRILLDIYNENEGISGVGKYNLIKSIIRNTMMRFKNKGNSNYLEKNYEHIYEIFSYVSLFNNVENRRDDFAEFQELILNNELNYVERRKKPIAPNDIIDAYEHFCLFNTQGHNLEFLASGVLGPYYLASYMYKYCALLMNTEMHNQTQLWEKFETILNNKDKRDDYLYDMLVFFFGIIHEGITEDARYNPDSLEYNVWIDYIVYKWNSVNNRETARKLLRERLKYLLESDFVKDSCLKRIIDSGSELSENEIQLKFILNEIK